MFKQDPRTIRGFLDTYVHPKKIHHPRPVHLIVDATYFGERKEGSSWCVIVTRDAITHEDLTWLFTDSESTSGYRALRDELEELGYIIQSVTADGFGGITTAFSGIPYQLCQVHLERLVIRGTTRTPKTEAGQVLLALGKSIHTTNSHTFHTRLSLFMEMYSDLLNEKTLNELTGKWGWTHRPLRQAALSLKRFKLFLFTFEHDHAIPKTTNSLEGHFAHLKLYLGVHRGVSRDQAQRILHSLLLASSVSPTKSVLRNIL
jgi:hypothetical protein